MPFLWQIIKTFRKSLWTERLILIPRLPCIANLYSRVDVVVVLVVVKIVSVAESGGKPQVTFEFFS